MRFGLSLARLQLFCSTPDPGWNCIRVWIDRRARNCCDCNRTHFCGS